MTSEKRAYYETRHAFRPKVGHVYENEGGGSFRCIDLFNFFYNDAVMRNVKSGWTFVAHGVGIYEDGRIDWDYSTGGYFAE